MVPGGVDRSGRERVIPALLWQIERLAARHELHVISTQPDGSGDTYELRGARVHVLSAAGALTRSRRLVAALRVLGPLDAIHAFWAGHGALVAGLVGRWQRCPIVVSLGGGELVSLPDIGYGGALRRRSRATARASLAMATTVTAASGPMMALARPFRPDVQCIPLGVDRRCFSPPSARPEGPPWRLLHVASLNRVKDQSMLIRALRRVVDRVPAVSLDVLGEDTMHGAIARMVHQQGLDAHVRFHGVQPTAAVAAACRAAHLFVLTSRHEAGPVAAVEAAASGLPVVGTAVGHLADWSPDAAVAVPPGDDAALADAIVALLADGGRRHRLADTARRWAERHDAEWTAGRFEALYAAGC